MVAQFHCLFSEQKKKDDKDLSRSWMKQMMNVLHSCNGKNNFMRWQMKCSIPQGKASLFVEYAITIFCGKVVSWSNAFINKCQLWRQYTFLTLPKHHGFGWQTNWMIYTQTMGVVTSNLSILVSILWRSWQMIFPHINHKRRTYFLNWKFLSWIGEKMKLHGNKTISFDTEQVNFVKCTFWLVVTLSNNQLMWTFVKSVCTWQKQYIFPIRENNFLLVQSLSCNRS